ASRPRSCRAIIIHSSSTAAPTRFAASSLPIREHVQSRYPLLAAVAAFAVVLACSKSSSASSPASTAGTDSALARRADKARILGTPTAKVWVVEVSDFQCPFCKQWHDQSYEAIKR